MIANQVHREFQNISEYRIIDESGCGESSVEIVYVNGPPEKFELASIVYTSKGIDLRLMIEGEKYFKVLTQEMEERVKKASSNLAEINKNIQKEVDAYQKYCQTVEPNVNLFSLFCFARFILEIIRFSIFGFFFYFDSQAKISIFCQDTAITGYEMLTVTF